MPATQKSPITKGQLALYILGFATLFLITGFSAWLIYAVGSVWWHKLFA